MATDTSGYIKAMIEWASGDLRQVYLRVTAALSIAVLFVTQIPLKDLQELDRWPTRAFFIGLGCLVLAAGMYFFYVDRTHRARREMACLLKPSAGRGDPYDILAKTYKRWKWALWLGNVAFPFGVGLLAYVLYALIAQH